MCGEEKQRFAGSGLWKHTLHMPWNVWILNLAINSNWNSEYSFSFPLISFYLSFRFVASLKVTLNLFNGSQILINTRNWLYLCCERGWVWVCVLFGWIRETVIFRCLVVGSHRIIEKILNTRLVLNNSVLKCGCPSRSDIKLAWRVWHFTEGLKSCTKTIEILKTGLLK